MDAVITKPETGGKWYSGMAGGALWTLFFGAMAGAAVGVLHLTAQANGWRRIEDVFKLLDAPVIALMDGAREKLDFPHWLAWYDQSDSLAVIFYWALIGVFVASFVCLARHRNYRRVTLFGAGGGMLAGCLNWLAIVNHWYRLWVSFAFLDRPVEPAREAIGFWINGHFRIRGLIPYVALTYVVYWLGVGLLLAFIFCLSRILVKRKAATGTQASKE